MKKRVPNKVEKYRVRNGPFATTESFGFNGHFYVPYKGRKLKVVVGVGAGWDHISISLPNRTPTWGEMCYIKDLFFDKEETAIQYHPPKSAYVNNNPHVLHIWRPHNQTIPMPPIWMV